MKDAYKEVHDKELDQEPTCEHSNEHQSDLKFESRLLENIFVNFLVFF